MKTYKGFNKDMTCRGFQFEIGKTYTHEGAVEACKSGFHACEYPLDTFNYYSPSESIYAETESEGDLKTHGADSKVASREITIKGSLTIPMLVSAAFEYTSSRCDQVKTQHSKGYRSASSATGYRSASSATGDQSASSATGYRSASSATGYRSASSATGDQSASSATGNRSASSATGYQSASSACGSNSVAMNIGVQGKAKASEGGAIVLCNHDSNYNIRFIRASKIGENGVEPDTWYILNDAGEFEKVQ